jgi:hypothetical protein
MATQMTAIHCFLRCLRFLLQGKMASTALCPPTVLRSLASGLWSFGPLVSSLAVS